MWTWRDIYCCKYHSSTSAVLEVKDCNSLVSYVIQMLVSDRKKFPIGVSKYLFWPGTTWASRLTSSHHLWTIPLVLWANVESLHVLTLPLSALAVIVNVSLSRLLIPHWIAASERDKLAEHYLNVNLAYEVWSDVKVPILYIFEDRIPHLIRLFVLASIFNVMAYVFMSTVLLWWVVFLERILGQSRTC